MTPRASTTGRWIRVAPINTLIQGEGIRIRTTPPIALFLVAGEVFCIDDTCTHATFSLAQGYVETPDTNSSDGARCFVECPLHLASFDLRTGEVLNPPATRPVAVHDTAVDDGIVSVRLPESYLPPPTSHRHDRSRA